jgi:hypothetical protein
MEIPPPGHEYWIKVTNIPVRKSQQNILILWADEPHFGFLDPFAHQYAMAIDPKTYRYIYPTHDYEELTHYMPIQLVIEYNK